MHKVLFGVFGPREALSQFRSPEGFDEVVAGEGITAGITDPGLGQAGRSATHVGEEGACLVYGEAYAPDAPDNVAEWTLRRYAEDGESALSELNGSYLVVVEHDGDARVVTDPLRSWECFYADVGGYRVFASDLSAIRPLLDRPRPYRESLLEYLHVGTVLGERTLLERVRRIPFDGYLTEEKTGELERFVYEPREFDYADQLAARMERAIERRSHLPGPKGLLLSGGKDSRVFLSKLDIDKCYTIGVPDCREVRAATKVAAQYGADHQILAPDERYLLADDDKVLYSQGIKESLHIHHAGYNDEFDVATMYHGVLFDTLLKGYFLQRDGIELFGSKLPMKRLDPDPDPIDFLVDTLGYLPEGSAALSEAAADVFPDVDLDLDDPEAFLRERLGERLRTCWNRTDSVHNAMDLLVIKNQPVLPFRTHLADNYFESFVAADSELLDWHLTTPPEYRRDDTFWRALKRVDPSIFHHRPPSQPHASRRLNEIERFVRRKLPLLEPFEAAWPDRDTVYREREIGEELFPTEPTVRELPARTQLRVNDARWWL